MPRLIRDGSIIMTLGFGPDSLEKDELDHKHFSNSHKIELFQRSTSCFGMELSTA